jgi:hypothetical protein
VTPKASSKPPLAQTQLVQWRIGPRRVFYALSLLTWADSPNPVRDSERAIAILNPIFAEHPDHPGIAHYIIHAADTPGLAAQGLDAARHYAQIAPAAPHALHMPSHIFARLGLWQEDIKSNLASLHAAPESECATARRVLTGFTLLFMQAPRFKPERLETTHRAPF